MLKKIQCEPLRKFTQGIYRLAQKPQFWVVIHVILFLVIFTFLTWKFYEAPTPGAIEKIVATKILEGQIPYIDFESEYPPIALILFIIPALFAKTLPPYYIAFTIEMLLFDLLAIALIIYISKRINMSKVRTLTVYTLLMAITAGPIVTQRYDLPAAVMVLAAVAAFIAGKNKTSWGIVAVGVMAKIFPVVVAPFFAIWLIIKKQYKQLAQGIAVFLGAILIIALPWLIVDAGSFWTMVSYHLDRGLHAESTYGSFIILGQLFKWTTVDYDFTYGSFNIDSVLADNFASASFYVMAGAFLVICLIFAYQLYKKQKAITNIELNRVETETLLIRYAAIAVLTFLIFNKVFSAQYMIWVCPLLPLISIRGNNIMVLLALIAGALSIYIYPLNYEQFEYYETAPVIIMAVRNLLVIAIFIIAFFPAKRNAMQMTQKQLDGL
ncbi:MAG: glycosyltransferase family 87 protein [Dehalococcoidales bacterium]|nr:glycosyltransferase family 87 protein [Dehalococcoidales bacterium]